MPDPTYWLAKVDEQKLSSTSCRQFCLTNELPYQTFLKWRRKFVEETPFVEIEQTDKLNFRCGKISMEVDAELSINSLSRLIAATQQANFLC